MLLEMGNTLQKEASCTTQCKTKPIYSNNGPGSQSKFQVSQSEPLWFVNWFWPKAKLWVRAKNWLRDTFISTTTFFMVTHADSFISPHFPQSNRNSDYSIILYRTINVFNDKINLTTQVNGIFFIELEKYSDEKQNSLCVKHSLLEFAPETSIKSISSGNPSFNSKR